MNQQADAIREQALLRMQISQQFMTFLKKAYQIFEDPEALIGKNITPTTFWFYIDALYFPINPTDHSNKIEQFMNPNRRHSFQFEEADDLQFILKLRKLISEEKMSTLNLQDIRSTSIDEVIEAAETYLQVKSQENIVKIQHLKAMQMQDCMKMREELQKFHVKFRSSHPMFYYQQLQAILRARWHQQHLQAQQKQKCFLCNQPTKLISCNSCPLKVHPSCYPTFANRYDNKLTKPTDQELRDFVCEDCVNGVDGQGDERRCQLCCCAGGYFVRVYQEQEGNSISFYKENINEENTKSTYISLKVKGQEEKSPKFVHLCCFIWNKDLKWNGTTKAVEGLNKAIKKKLSGACSLCGISFGAVIPCSNETCRRFYHGQCAKRNKLEMSLIRAKTSVIELYCQRHRHLNRFQSLQQVELNRFREAKKMLEVLDKQIKRLHVASSYQQVKLVVQRDYCSICGKQEGWEKITICKLCRKWYHNNCSQNCRNCV